MVMDLSIAVAPSVDDELVRTRGSRPVAEALSNAATLQSEEDLERRLVADHRLPELRKGLEVTPTSHQQLHPREAVGVTPRT
jgi:hypothetical protein